MGMASVPAGLEASKGRLPKAKSAFFRRSRMRNGRRAEGPSDESQLTHDATNRQGAYGWGI